MLRRILLILSVFVPVQVFASWELSSNGFSHRIVTSNEEGQQLVVDAGGDSADFLINIKNKPENPTASWPVRIHVDGKLSLDGELQFVLPAFHAGSAKLHLTDDQKINLMNHMISGLFLTIAPVDGEKGRPSMTFTLVGFTAALNDLLIANVVGKFDFEWLLETHREREMFCLYAANVTVKAMGDRNSGKTQAQSLADIRSTGIEILDEGVLELVGGVYRLPMKEIPKEPNSEKYGIFLTCMKR